MEHVLITICGRAGSKGFKNKKLKIFDGLPLSHYSLAAAKLFEQQLSLIHIFYIAMPDNGISWFMDSFEFYPEVHVDYSFGGGSWMDRCV